MKKILTLLSLLTCLAFAGCDTGAASGSVDPGTITPEQQAAIEAHDKVVEEAEMAQKKVQGE